jgi:hypothetical protein
MKFLIIIFLVFTSSIFPKERIVVLEFLHPPSVSEEIAISCYKFFVSELARIERFTIIEKKELRAVMNEIKFQQSGCTDTICEIKIGQMLYANKIASGNIIKIGTKYIITISLRNVSDKNLEFTETINLYDLNNLETSMNTLAQKLIPLENPKKNLKPKVKKYTDEEIEVAGKKSVLPGLGHFHLNQDSWGWVYTSVFVLTLYNTLVVVPYSNKQKVADKEKLGNESILLYYIVNRDSNPMANHPILLSLLGKEAMSINRDTANGGKWRQLNSFFPIYGIMLLSVLDINLIRKGSEISNFNVSFTYERMASYSPNVKGTYFEISYTARF